MSYNKIILYPDVEFNYLVYKKETASSNDISTMNASTVNPDFGTLANLKIVCPFDTDLQSSVISNLTENVNGWNVYRQKIGETTQKFIAYVPSEQLYLYDYLCSNNSLYKYTVIPVTDNLLGVALESNSISTNWWGYTLVGIKKLSDGEYEPDEVWTFDYNLTSTEIVQNLDVATMQTFTRTPKIYKGVSNYQTMGITALLGGVSCANQRYVDNQKLLEDWQSFVAKDNLCVWKDRKGAVKFGKISGMPSTKLTDELIEQNASITFEFTETNENEVRSVYGITDTVYNMFAGNQDDYEGYVPYCDGGSSIKVINNLTSHSIEDALSANQGRVLDGKVSDVDDKIGDVNSVLDEISGEVV